MNAPDDDQVARELRAIPQAVTLAAYDDGVVRVLVLQVPHSVQVWYRRLDVLKPPPMRCLMVYPDRSDGRMAALLLADTLMGGRT